MWRYFPLRLLHSLLAFSRLPVLACRDICPCLFETQLRNFTFLEQCVWLPSSPCLSGPSCHSQLRDMFFNVRLGLDTGLALLYGWISLLSFLRAFGLV